MLSLGKRRKNISAHADLTINNRENIGINQFLEREKDFFIPFKIFKSYIYLFKT